MLNEQRSEQWFEDRLGRATASRAADVLATIKSGEAAARRNYRAELVVERLTGAALETYTSKEMTWGIENEPVARLMYELMTGNIVDECYFFTHKELMAGASPDGLIAEDGTIEIKCPLTATHIETLRTGVVPDRYLKQIIWQQWITGRKWTDYVSFDPRLPENAQLFIKRVERDEKEIEKIEAAAIAFLQEVDGEMAFVQNYGKPKKVLAKQASA